jgi:2-polyprenyl-3-methyl-5-hydroxy-6-metoxy-1,4-benzoquinol methylase
VSIVAPQTIPALHIVPAEARQNNRDPGHRPDWWGTAAAPSGPVASFVETVLTAHTEAAAVTELAYADEGFASAYLAASAAGDLRDHRALDDLVAAALLSGERLSSARILDIGCGAGRWAVRLAEAGAREVVGVEPAPTMARAAKARGLPRFVVHACPIERYVLEGTFDAVPASMSLDHVDQVEVVLRRITRHLAPRGSVVITTEHPLRTAPLDGERWTEAPGGSRAARVRDYGREGYQTTAKVRRCSLCGARPKRWGARTQRMARVPAGFLGASLFSHGRLTDPPGPRTRDPCLAVDTRCWSRSSASNRSCSLRSSRS